MKRRGIIGAAGLCTAWGRAVAQPARKVYRIGILGSQLTAAEMAGPQTLSPPINALLRGLRELGYVYGEQFVTVARSGEGKPERLPALAAELVGLQPDVIVAAGPTLPALKRATTTIPIIMTGAGDPVAQGFVQSLARPGGNITGMSLQSVDITGKRLELLVELVRPTGLIALLVFNSALFDRQAGRIAALAASRRLPAMYGLRFFVEAGGLMSYGPDLVENWRRSAVFVDKILKGAKPGDLPVEQPTKFELVINLTTARALGLTIPQALLLRADEVIQ